MSIIYISEDYCEDEIKAYMWELGTMLGTNQCSMNYRVAAEVVVMWASLGRSRFIIHKVGGLTCIIRSEFLSSTVIHPM